ncbi:MAG: hypothetical protein U1F09_14285 [Steroidobacteraceae bacterium]
MTSPPDPSALASASRRTGAALRLSLELSLCGLALSGALWLLAVRVLAVPDEFGVRVPDWTPRVLAIHGGLAMIFLVATGGWLQQHVGPRIARPVGRWSGMLQLSLLALLGASGYGLYYWADEQTRPAWSNVHWIAGLLLLVTLLLHRRVTRS